MKIICYECQLEGELFDNKLKFNKKIFKWLCNQCFDIVNKKSKSQIDEEFMISLDWDLDDLNKAIEALSDWDKRDDKYYISTKADKLSKQVDLAEREHYRNCINFWKERLSNENKQT